MGAVRHSADGYIFDSLLMPIGAYQMLVSYCQTTKVPLVNIVPPALAKHWQYQLSISNN